MARNPILEEIYAAREKLLADCNGDVHTYVESARQRALSSGRRIAAPKERAKQFAPAAGVTTGASAQQTTSDSEGA